MEEQAVTQEREPVYTLDTCYPEERYTKAMFIPTIRKPLKFCKYAVLFVLAELLALSVLDQKWCGTLLVFAALYLLLVFGIPLNAKKKYRQIHAVGEDRISYKFYEDSVQVKSPTAEVLLDYNTAESNMENETYLMINFRLGRKVVISKESCADEQLAFFRGIVPPETQQKREKSAAVAGWVCIAAVILYVLLLAAQLILICRHKTPDYTAEYPRTTYESFEKCLYDGHVKDIEIFNDRFVEYTFTGHAEEERLFTVFEGDLSELKEKLRFAYGAPYTKTTCESFMSCLIAGTVTDVEIIRNRFVEYTYTGNGRTERLYTIAEEDVIGSLPETLSGLGVDWKYRETD